MSLTRTRKFKPGWGLGNAHVQSVLSSSAWRGRYARRCMANTGATHSPQEICLPDGVRLQGILSSPPDADPRVLVVLLHGWEGSVDSNYMQCAASSLLGARYRVFRLNFRDHGDSHHLNEAIFHSARIDEVVDAIAQVSGSVAHNDLFVAGYSLGGNFALRTGIHARGRLPTLRQTFAICPPLNPHHTMDRMESGPRMYLNYFEHKWRRSLRKKRTLFPELHAFADEVLKLPLRALTGWMVDEHTEFASIEDYFDAYLISDADLAASTVPARILMSEDDPVIPVADFAGLAEVQRVELELEPGGGHCGFVLDWGMHGYSEQWLRRGIDEALTRARHTGNIAEDTP